MWEVLLRHAVHCKRLLFHTLIGHDLSQVRTLGFALVSFDYCPMCFLLYSITVRVWYDDSINIFQSKSAFVYVCATHQIDSCWSLNTWVLV
jgi:hypothetical protein